MIETHPLQDIGLKGMSEGRARDAAKTRWREGGSRTWRTSQKPSRIQTSGIIEASGKGTLTLRKGSIDRLILSLYMCIYIHTYICVFLFLSLHFSLSFFSLSLSLFSCLSLAALLFYLSVSTSISMSLAFVSEISMSLHMCFLLCLCFFLSFSLSPSPPRSLLSSFSLYPSLSAFFPSIRSLLPNFLSCLLIPQRLHEQSSHSPD